MGISTIKGKVIRVFKLTNKTRDALRYMEEQRPTCPHLILMYGRCANCGMNFK